MPAALTEKEAEILERLMRNTSSTDFSNRFEERIAQVRESNRAKREELAPDEALLQMRISL